MPSTSRGARRRDVRRVMLRALLLSAPSASRAFQSSRAAPCAPRSTAGSDVSVIDDRSRRQRLAAPGSGRTNGFSSTSLCLFRWNEEEEEAPLALELADEIDTFRYLFGRNKIEEETPPEPADEDDDANYFARSLSFLRVAFPSFLAGGAATLAVLFLPLLADYYDAFKSMGPGGEFYNYNPGTSKADSKDSNGMANNVNQPVILFETILNNLNSKYVDDVDVQKLFETGVRAMTSSLDPYTEFESRLEAREMAEGRSGKYGGVGLVIRGGAGLGDPDLEDEDVAGGSVEKIEASPALKDGEKAPSKDGASSPVAMKDTAKGRNKSDKKATGDEELDSELAERRRARRKSMEDGLRVVSAFEGYAYDAGMRVGDKLLAVDDLEIKPTTTVREVRNYLRGDPGTKVDITFLREGAGRKNQPQTVTLERAVVRIPDVKYFGFIGDPSDRIGYIDLSGFANDAGKEVRFAIQALQHGAEMYARGADGSEVKGMASVDSSKLKGLVLDLRSNPGGLLTSAVDVAELFVPNGSDIVSAKGRGFPERIYRSNTEPILNPNTRLAVLVNEQTASAAEIVTGAVQDLDVGVVVGRGRTYGKGLVQNVQDLPYQTALKYTVAKYYTPSGRCIQSTIYSEGSASDGGNGGVKYKSEKVADKDRAVFYTAHGREVKDGGGVEVDYKVEPQRASRLGFILLNSGAYGDYAAEWSKNHELTDNFKVDEATYRDFQRFVEKRQSDGDMKLEIVYDAELKELQKKLKASKFDSSRRELDRLRLDIIRDVKKEFSTSKAEITEELEQSILARYLPDSTLIERGLKSDYQVAETVKLLKDGKEFDKILPREYFLKEKGGALKNAGEGDETLSAMTPGPTLQTRW